ncbi:MAG: pyrimidine dimer DNA glycosylase/endonuclease V [Candidatus Bathyarchaeia archaeon]
MRLWSIHPQYLDWMGLGGLWREGLLAQAVLLGKTEGWVNHPQLDRFKDHPQPVKAIGYYLIKIHEEATRRSYNYTLSKIQMPARDVKPISITDGQLVFEYKLLMDRLKIRTPEKFEDNKGMGISIPTPHPIFDVVSGPPGRWETSYWKSGREGSLGSFGKENTSSST